MNGNPSEESWDQDKIYWRQQGTRTKRAGRLYLQRKVQCDYFVSKGHSSLTAKAHNCQKRSSHTEQKTPILRKNMALTSMRKAVALTWLISLVSWDKIVTPMMQYSTLSWLKKKKVKQKEVVCEADFSTGNASHPLEMTESCAAIKAA